MVARSLDIIIFGATGFTGKHTIPIVHKHANGLKWGIAGRSESKLKEIALQFEKSLNLKDIPIIIADVKNEISLREMAKQTRIIINCCGPYRFYGEDVIKACIEEGTHHVDVSGETEYMEDMQLKYDKQAREKNVYIISACGFDSIPTDMGVLFLQQNFQGTLNSVETYLTVGKSDSSLSGPLINYGTWESLVYSLASTDRLREIRRQLYSKRLPAFKPKLEFKKMPHKTSIAEGWMLPFLGSDRAVVRRTQRYLYETEHQRPIQIETYFSIGSTFYLILFMFMGSILQLLAKFNYGRYLLLEYPHIFSLGMFSKSQPSEETISASKFCILLYGKGWREKLTEPSDEYQDATNATIIGKVQGTNPGYGATCEALALSAITVLKETENLANNGKGGVYSPGAAFAKTNLIDNLKKNGITFEVVEESLADLDQRSGSGFLPSSEVTQTIADYRSNKYLQERKLFVN